MSIIINREEKGLLQDQIFYQMVSILSKNEYRIWDQLPSIRALSRQIKVSINTVVAVYNRLIDEGYLVAKANLGFFVAPMGTNVQQRRQPKKYFEQGDIIKVCLNPAEGRESKGLFKPCLVLSSNDFNTDATALVAPISRKKQYRNGAYTLTVPLTESNIKTQGVILLHHARMLDVRARKGKYVEKAPLKIVEKSLATLASILYVSENASDDPEKYTTTESLLES